jgi:hypothetical protein
MISTTEKNVVEATQVKPWILEKRKEMQTEQQKIEKYCNKINQLFSDMYDAVDYELDEDGDGDRPRLCSDCGGIFSGVPDFPFHNGLVP